MRVSYHQIEFYNCFKLAYLFHISTAMSNGANKTTNKQIRKPISPNFSPKRLAISYDPPTIIMEYLVIDNGKLYHHKIHLRSVMQKTNVNRIDVLNYVKNKHFLYFVNGKVKDTQLLKFIDRIIAKIKGKVIQSNTKSVKANLVNPPNINETNQDDAFDYLNDDQYEQDYEQDYEQPEDQPPPKPQQQAKKQTNQMQFNKNTFMTYCQQEDESYDEAAAEWDLDLDGSADFV